jgi:hypothetical protein
MDYMQKKCVHLNLNFIGLFDTVPHHGFDQDNDIEDLELGLPSSADFVAHAVAANEHRKDFAAVSIHNSPGAGSSSNRVEKSFIGAHADIGGGYGEGDLSDVAFMWMVKQATNKGNVNIDFDVIRDAGWNIVTNPILHDNRGVCVAGGLKCFNGPDRDFKYLNRADRVQQKNVQNLGLTYQESLNYFDNRFYEYVQCGRGSKCLKKGMDIQGDRTLVGVVSTSYSKWLQQNYGINVTMNYSQLGDAN